MKTSADYLVVGAGLSGLAFVDTLIAESAESTVIVIDRASAPGGHWLYAYPFVRLHSPSWYYGVNSLHLGEDKRDVTGLNAGLYERAAKDELLTYFAAVAQRLEATGRVHFLFGHSWDDSGEIRSAAGEVVDVEVRRAVVDARYLENAVPATHRPSFGVASHALFGPVGELPVRADSADDFVVLGAGKTGADACLWLLDDAGVDPDRIRWVRPRDAWWHNRSLFQGGDLVRDALNGFATEATLIASATSLSELQDRLEDAGNLMRLDPGHRATMFRGGMLSAAEADVLRQVRNVVRLGHVVRVERRRVVLDGGVIDTGPRSLVVDCTARGLAQQPPVPIWRDGRITVQLVREHSPPFSAAVIGWLEAHREAAVEKNRLCVPNPAARSIDDYPLMKARTWTTEAAWQPEADLRGWLGRSRLHLMRDLAAHRQEPAVQASLQALVGTIGGAIENSTRLSP